MGEVTDEVVKIIHGLNNTDLFKLANDLGVPVEKIGGRRPRTDKASIGKIRAELTRKITNIFITCLLE